MSACPHEEPKPTHVEIYPAYRVLTSPNQIPANQFKNKNISRPAHLKVYHVLEGEGLMEIAGERQIVRKHDVIYLPPGVPHSISNTGLATSPVTDEEPG
jgi:mannose-6-phosphate isomerase-like protein (cupin superfamily)